MQVQTWLHTVESDFTYLQFMLNDVITLQIYALYKSTIDIDTDMSLLLTLVWQQWAGHSMLIVANRPDESRLVAQQ